MHILFFVMKSFIKLINRLYIFTLKHNSINVDHFVLLLETQFRSYSLCLYSSYGENCSPYPRSSRCWNEVYDSVIVVGQSAVGPRRGITPHTSIVIAHLSQVSSHLQQCLMARTLPTVICSPENHSDVIRSVPVGACMIAVRCRPNTMSALLTPVAI